MVFKKLDNCRLAEAWLFEADGNSWRVLLCARVFGSENKGVRAVKSDSVAQGGWRAVGSSWDRALVLGSPLYLFGSAFWGLPESCSMKRLLGFLFRSVFLFNRHFPFGHGGCKSCVTSDHRVFYSG